MRAVGVSVATVAGCVAARFLVFSLHRDDYLFCCIVVVRVMGVWYNTIPMILVDGLSMIVITLCVMFGR